MFVHPASNRSTRQHRRPMWRIRHPGHPQSPRSASDQYRAEHFPPPAHCTTIGRERRESIVLCDFPTLAAQSEERSRMPTAGSATRTRIEAIAGRDCLIPPRWTTATFDRKIMTAAGTLATVRYMSGIRGAGIRDSASRSGVLPVPCIFPPPRHHCSDRFRKDGTSAATAARGQEEDDDDDGCTLKPQIICTKEGDTEAKIPRPRDLLCCLFVVLLCGPAIEMPRRMPRSRAKRQNVEPPQ